MKVIDLFSGIGGFSYGLSLSGKPFKTIAFCEQDKFCQKVLKKHWPDIPIYNDIRRLDGKQFRGTVGLICGGFPCQPFSIAGKRRGNEDHRDLWPEMLRIIREVRPAWVLGENVANFAGMDGGYNRTHSDLEKEGYEVRAFEIPAIGLGAPHIRKRLWIVGHLAHSNGVGYGRGKGKGYRNDKWEFFESQRERCSVGSKTSGRSGKSDLAHSDSIRSQRIWPDGDKEGWERQEKGTSGLCNRTGNAYNNWEIEPNVGRVANGVPSRVDRIKALGNSVVPQIVAEIGRAIEYNHKRKE